MLIEYENLADQIVFGQTHLGTQDYLGSPPPRLRDFPHYIILKINSKQQFKNNAYIDYLRNSWGLAATDVNIRGQRARSN